MKWILKDLNRIFYLIRILLNSFIRNVIILNLNTNHENNLTKIKN